MPLSEIFSKSFEDYKKNWKLIFRGYFWLNVLPYLVMMLVLFGMLFFLIDAIMTSATAIVPEDFLNGEGLYSLTGNAIGSGEMQLIKAVLPVVILAVAFFVIYIILTFILNLSIYYASLNNEKGKLTFKEAARGGIRYFWRILGLCILLFLIFLFFLLLISIPILITSLLWAISPLALKVILVLICVIVGILIVLFTIYLWISWLFAVYVIIKENSGIVNSLSRSRELVRGRWWLTFGYFLLISIILWIISYIINALSGLISLLFERGMNPLLASQSYSLLVVLGFFSVIVAYIFQLIARVLTFPYSVFFFKNIYYEYAGFGVKGSKKKKSRRKGK